MKPLAPHQRSTRPAPELPFLNRQPSRRCWPLAACVALGLILSLSACLPSDEARPDGSRPNESDSLAVSEAPIHELSLGSPLDAASAEISGLTWYGDTLVVLPQYPAHGSQPNERRLWGIARTDLLRHLNRTSPADSPGAKRPLSPFPIRLIASHLGTHSTDYEGCEAIAFGGGRLFVLTESRGTTVGMSGHLVSGRIAPDLAPVRLDATAAQMLPRQTDLNNMSYEALTLYGDTLVALYEANGAHVNPAPRAYRFGLNLQPLSSVPAPTLEYRITDATSVDGDGRFWVINYFYPGERALLNPATDSLALRDGLETARTHTGAVERLVEYRMTGRRIERTRTPPIWLRTGGSEGRNWEGIVRFGDGFLLATDRFPKTMLAYVEASR